ncbi:porin [Candidatus Omnitrophota bacterium]
MRKVTVFVVMVILFVFSYTYIARADEISELKSQMKTMQKLLQEQSSQMKAMQERIEKLETEKATRIKTPKEMEERVAVLEKKAVKKGNLQARWKDGLRLTSEDKSFDIKIGGRVQVDAAWMKEESAVKNKVGDMKDEAEIRRARLYTSGTIYDSFIYKVQFDFAGGDVDFKDVYMGVKDIPYLGTIRAGHFHEPYCLNELTSNKYLTFMERALPDAFAPGRNLGIALQNHILDDRVTWSAGVFRDADDYARVHSNEYNFTTRFTGLPWYEDGGEKLVHMGLAYSFRNPEENLRYHQRPEAHLAPYFVDTGSFAAKHAHLLGYETAVVYGPLSLQGEFMQSFVNQAGGGLSDTYFQGLYAQTSYFLTGEHRNYSKSNGVFSRVRPNNNFSIKDQTFGAWELAARYSYLDLQDNGIYGGTMSDVTVGLNWYLNPNMRIMGNYVHSYLDDTGDADIFLTRVQFDF